MAKELSLKESVAFLNLKKAMDKYSVIPEESFKKLRQHLTTSKVKKSSFVLNEGEIAKEIFFVEQGILRSLYTDDKGSVYSKNLFLEGSLAASKVSLLRQEPSYFGIEALEDSFLVHLPYSVFRNLIDEDLAFKNYYLKYLEENWVIQKEERELAIVTQSAGERYQKLLTQFPDIENRVAQFHIASHLGITPTQLSRIRKTYEKKIE